MPAINPIPDTLVLPAGATTGQRIVLDGTNGQILLYDANNNLVAQIAPSVGVVTVTSPYVSQLVNGSAAFQTANTRYFGFIEERDVTISGVVQHSLVLGVADKQNNIENDLLVTLQDNGNSQVIVQSALLTDGSTWEALALASGINANTSVTPSCHTFPDGTAVLRGSLNSTGSVPYGTVLAQLPAGATPSISDYYPTVCSTGAGPVATYLQITNTGQIIYRGNTGTLGYLFLAGIRYPVLI